MNLFKLINLFRKTNGRSPSPNELAMLKRQVSGVGGDNIIQFPGGDKSGIKSLDEFTKSENIYEQSMKPKGEGTLKFEEELNVNLYGDETFEELMQIKDTGKHPRDKAAGGRIGFFTGGAKGLLKLLQGKLGKKTVKMADDVDRPQSALDRDMFKEADDRFNTNIKDRTSKNKMSKTMMDEGYADPEYLDPNALDMYGEPITMDKAFFDKTREQTMKRINEQERLMVPRNHRAYRDLQHTLKLSKNRLNALDITEEVGGNIKMFDKLRMKDLSMSSEPLSKFKYIKGTPADESKKGIDYLFDKDGVLDKDAVLRDITEKLKSRVPKKAGQGKFTKAQVLIARLENTIKTSKDPYVLKKFPEFIEEIKAKPELANNKNVFETLSGPLPKGQKFVEYDDGTMDFFQKTDFGPQNIAPAQKLAEELGISTSEASAILKMEPEDQVLEIGRRKALAKQIDNLGDDTVSEEPTSLYDENFDDYFDPDDKPKQAKGGIVSLV